MSSCNLVKASFAIATLNTVETKVNNYLYTRKTTQT